MKQKLAFALCKSLLLALLLSFSNWQPVLALAKQNQPALPAGNISRIIETRGRRRACWGLKIELETARFKKRIRPGALKIVEGKHDHDLTNLMAWVVSTDGKTLTIKFRPNTGDFGSGNRVEVRLSHSAFISGIEFSANETIWMIETDIP